MPIGGGTRPNSSEGYDYQVSNKLRSSRVYFQGIVVVPPWPCGEAVAGVFVACRGAVPQGALLRLGRVCFGLAWLWCGANGGGTEGRDLERLETWQPRYFVAAGSRGRESLVEVGCPRGNERERERVRE